MKNKIKISVIIAVLIAFAGVQVYAAQQANEYKAYVYMQSVQGYADTDGTNTTMHMWVTYVPVYPGPTYTLTYNSVDTPINLAQPTKINDQLAQAVKIDGLEKGYAVIRVFLPSYEMKIP